MQNNNDKLNALINKYNLNNQEKQEFLTIIEPIFLHAEFQKRMTNPFLHHGNISLGEHILEDSIVTYKLAIKKNLKRKKKINVSLAVKIAMFHDLYEEPWQNNNRSKEKYFFNKHGFRHPIEAIINAYNWYPELFTDSEDTKIIIDGVLHHMFPLPVASRKTFVNNDYELNNYDGYLLLPEEIRKMITNSLQKSKLGTISFRHSQYREGRIMAKADRHVSFHQIKDFSSAKALLTGHNKKIDK